jgi:glycerol-3-phosphate dehydrogenase subunit C
MIGPGLSADLCLKCNICTASCPVAAVTDLFPGPKAVGPQFERYRQLDAPSVDASVTWCSGCGTCTRVCPHGVNVAEMNILAKAELAARHPIPLRDQFMSRPQWLGRLGSPLAPLANFVLSQPVLRILLEYTIGIARHAAMPAFASSTLRHRQRARLVKTPAQVPASDATVAYYHGCSANYYEPQLAETAIAVLESLGCRIVIPPQVCCGLPLQSNGMLGAARRQARSNIRTLAPFARAGIPIVGTSTSCTLSLKHDYQNILGIEGEDAAALAQSTYDIFEFLAYRFKPALDQAVLQDVPMRALYHPPCQLKSHFMGFPAIPVLRRIPGLDLHLSDSECCGVAGTYGLKKEKYKVARDVGETLFTQASRLNVDCIITDSETCRWWISRHTGIPALHPVQILAQSLRLPS